MNTKELLSAARFGYTRIDDNDIKGITRLESAMKTMLFTTDGAVYLIPDQEVEIEESKRTNGAGVADVQIKAIMPGRLAEDQYVEVYLEIQKLSPLTMLDLREFLTRAQQEPM